MQHTCYLQNSQRVSVEIARVLNNKGVILMCRKVLQTFCEHSTLQAEQVFKRINEKSKLIKFIANTRTITVAPITIDRYATILPCNICTPTFRRYLSAL